MGAATKIAWAHDTFNAWWGCHKVSPACKNCYAEAWAKRTGNNVWGADAPRRFFGDKHWREPLKWNREAEATGERRRVFCGSMMDVFEQHAFESVALAMAEARIRLAALISDTPWLDWLLLTKRPESFRDAFGIWFDGCPRNVWVGTTVEHQLYADTRIPHLLSIPARVHFLSCEPLLGHVDLRVLRTGDFDSLDALTGVRSYAGRGSSSGRDFQQYRSGVDWVIAGGESGPKHREHQLEWSRSLRDQCAAAGVPFFFKQLGENPTEVPLKWSLDVPPTRLHLPLKPRSKGELLVEIPPDLRIRELPRIA